LSNADAPALATGLLRPFRDALIVDTNAEQAVGR
jgi:hypothetical protein